MNRQNHRAAGRRVGTKRRGDVAALTQIEAVERFVGEQHRLRHQQADGEERALALPFRQAADGGVEQRRDVEPLHDLVAQMRAAAEESEREVDRPAHRLCRPRHDGVGQIEERGAARAVAHRLTVVQQRSRVERQHAAEALEQRGLSGAVWTDQAKHFPGPDAE